MTALGKLESSEFSAEKSIVAVRNGCQTSLGPLLDFYRNYLLKVAHNRLRPDISVKFAPSDLVQETLKDAVKRFGQFRGTTDPQLKAWLKTILLNRVHDANRRFLEAEQRDVQREISIFRNEGSSQGLLATLEASLTPSQPVLVEEKIRLFSAAVNQLTDELKDVIELRTFEKLTFEQIGQRLGCSSKGASRLWSRAVETLGRELRRMDPSFHDRL